MASKESINKARTHTINPEASLDLQTTLHIERMQSLLEEYDCENSFLNKQIIELLDNKKNIVAKSYHTISNKEYEKNDKLYSGAYLRDKVYQDLAKKPVQSRNSSNKKKYEYIDEREISRPITSTYDRYRSSSSRKYELSQHTTAPSKKIENIESKFHLSKFAKSNSNLGQIKYQYAKPFIYGDEPVSPEITSRFLNEKEVKNQVNIEEVRTMPNYDETKDVLPILKRDPYIQQSITDRSSVENSPERSPMDKSYNKNSQNSLKSSRKSGIKVVSSEKDVLKNNNDILSPSRPESIKEETKSKEPSPSKQTKRVSFIEEENQIKLLPSLIDENKSPERPDILKNKIETIDKEKQNQKLSTPKNENEANNKFKLADSPEVKMYGNLKSSKKPSITYSEVGINTEPNAEIKSTTSLSRDRSSSQHRIPPSDKIIYSSDSVQISRKGSQSSLRGQSKEKKKFISIVSSTLLAQKLGK